MQHRWQLLLSYLRERLWVKPLAVCLLSIGGAFLAHLADGTGLGPYVPQITTDSIETLLKLVSASMLVIATFAVASMVSAYASASGSATPRSFSLIIADDRSQNSLSTFIGAFIFSVVALVALMNGYFGDAGRFALFVLTMVVFAIVVLTFVRWVDSIARLGRLGNTIDRVEAAAATAFDRHLARPRLGGIAAHPALGPRHPVVAEAIGYVRRINIAALQAHAERAGLRITVAALPGAFCTPSRPLAHVSVDAGAELTPEDVAAIEGAFVVGDTRGFDQDPRFGLIVLSEIASRALSPAVNDPGTAIDVIGTLVRLFAKLATDRDDGADDDVRFDRVAVPDLAMDDLFDDAFTGIARDGAGCVEVAVRLQKGLEALSHFDHPALVEAARVHARLALTRADHAMAIPHDLEAVRRAAAFAAEDGSTAQDAR